MTLIDPRTFENDQEFSGAKGLVMLGENTIVYRRSSDAPQAQNLIDLPGGGREGSESPYQTFAREVKEEFGLIIGPKDIIYGRRYQGKQNQGHFGYHLVAQLPASTESQIHYGNEGVGYTLMSLNDYLNRADAWAVYQERTRDYLAAISSSSQKNIAITSSSTLDTTISAT